MEKENILIACVGITDPIRSDYDGPILHITRYYHPKKIYMILIKTVMYLLIRSGLLKI